MTRFSFNCRLHLIFCIMVLVVTGCTLDGQGLQPALYCGITSIQYDVGPCSSTYHFTGVCDLEGETANYEVMSYWKAKNGNAGAIVNANYQGNNVSESVVATCPGGDPMINDNVVCSNRAFNGNIFSTIPWSYESYQASNFIPDFLGEEIKAIIRAQAQWPKTSPTIQSPKEQVRYKCGTPCNAKLLTSMQLPVKMGNISDWEIQFYYRKWDQGHGAWSSNNYKIIDNLLRTDTGILLGYTFLDLTAGRYQLGNAMSIYTDGNCEWESDLTQVPIEFYVGPILKMPHGTGVPAHADSPDYQIRSFEGKVVPPGQRSFTGEVVDKKSLSYRWQVNNLGKKQSPKTTFSVKCEAVGNAPCPSEFPLSRTINPIDSETSSGEYIGVTVSAPASEAKYRFLATVDPDNAVVDANKGNNSLYSQFVYIQPKVISDAERLKELAERFDKSKGKVTATLTKKISLVQVLLPKKTFRRDEAIFLRTIVPAAQTETVEIERQEGGLWLKSKEPVIRADKSIRGSSFKSIRHDVSVKKSGKLRARAKVADGPWSNWAYFNVD